MFPLPRKPFHSYMRFSINNQKKKFSDNTLKFLLKRHSPSYLLGVSQRYVASKRDVGTTRARSQLSNPSTPPISNQNIFWVRIPRFHPRIDFKVNRGSRLTGHDWSLNVPARPAWTRGPRRGLRLCPLLKKIFYARQSLYRYCSSKLIDNVGGELSHAEGELLPHLKRASLEPCALASISLLPYMN